MKSLPAVVLVLLLGLLISCSEENTSKSKKIKLPKRQPIPVLKYSVDKKLPHSSNSFTEGFLFYNDQLFESTGSPQNLPSTQSVYGTVNSKSGEINTHNKLDPKYFGEGITILNDKVYQLTYKSREGFVYDLNTKKRIKSFQIPTREGWGLTTDGESLIMSDGSSNLHFIDPNTLEKTATLKVFDNGRPLHYLNELEFVDNFIYANVYTTDWIVKIDLDNGKVVAKIDLTDLKLEEDRIGDQALETNGIAYHPIDKKLYVTGKMWQNIYVINLFNP
jgi:glutamine cyclotransferase